jgi:imidazole glycerol-phosphate synthase subunit HisF
MRRTRVIPSLLLSNSGFYKTTKFKKPNYLGDPINIIKIFNDKEVDEICILDIEASQNNLDINFDYLSDLASECFVPLTYGGAINSIANMAKILRLGFEKCLVGSAFYQDNNLVRIAAENFGSQSVVVSIDFKKKLMGGYEVFYQSGNIKTGYTPKEAALLAQEMGAGEILLTSINNEGMMDGYSLEIINEICKSVEIPVIANGGAGSLEDLKLAANNGASAVAAGSFFVYTGPHKAVLINVPTEAQLDDILP